MDPQRLLRLLQAIRTLESGGSAFVNRADAEQAESLGFIEILTNGYGVTPAGQTELERLES